MSRRFRPGWIPTLAAAGSVALLCGLGVWQVRRHDWRQADLAAKHARIELPPVPVEEALRDPAAHTHRRATARGRYDHDASILVIRVPREGREGARVLTPLHLEGGAGWILVDRGWIPYARQEGFLAQDESDGPVEVTGLLHRLAVRAEAPAAPDGAVRVRWPRFDPTRPAQVAALQRQLPYRLAPLMIQRGEDGGGSLPIGGFARPRSPVDHRTYAVTWFGLAAIALATWIGLGLKQGREAEPRA